MTLDQHLRILRDKRGITQKYLSEEINVSIQSIHKWENGKTLPDAINLLNLARFYNISLDTLMDNEIHSDLVNKKIYNFSIQNSIKRIPVSYAFKNMFILLFKIFKN